MRNLINLLSVPMNTTSGSSKNHNPTIKPIIIEATGITEAIINNNNMFKWMY